MDTYWYGQACFKIKGKNATLLIDPFDPDSIGLKAPKASDLEADVLLITHAHPDHNFAQSVSGNPVVIQGPGEFEVKGVTITGVSLFHDKVQGQDRGKIAAYCIDIDGITLVHLGDLGHTLNDDQSAQIGNPDILMVPVGGNYTIDAKEASEVVSELEAKVIIPMHFDLGGMKVELSGVDKFLKEMGKEGIEPQNKLTITKDKIPEEPEVVVLNKS